MRTVKNYNDFLNESKSENNEEIYNFIRNTVASYAIHFGFEEGERFGDDEIEGGDLILWNDNNTPTEDDWEKFWDYVESVVWLYDDVIHDEWKGGSWKKVKKIFNDNLNGKVKNIFKEEYMKAVTKPEKPVESEEDKKLRLKETGYWVYDKNIGQKTWISKNGLYQRILNKYVGKVQDEDSMDNYSDEFEYYDNVITQAVADFINAEEPEKEDDYDYKDELENGLKDYWSPI